MTNGLCPYWVECSSEDAVTNASTFSPNGLPFPVFNTTDSCLTACVSYFDNCVAVDISVFNGQFICWIHTNISDLEMVYSWENVSQSRFTSCEYRGMFLEPKFCSHCVPMEVSACRTREDLNHIGPHQ